MHGDPISFFIVIFAIIGAIPAVGLFLGILYMFGVGKKWKNGFKIFIGICELVIFLLILIVGIFAFTIKYNGKI